jgi:hypothetical protein
MSDEEYFRSCIAKERHLAHLLGHQHIEECYESAGTLWENADALPMWTRDWAACGPLIAKYELTIHYDNETGALPSASVTVGTVTVQFSDHPTKDRAIMYAIVKAVIVILEHPKHCGH